jgi:hypothetical protein
MVADLYPGALTPRMPLAGSGLMQLLEGIYDHSDRTLTGVVISEKMLFNSATARLSG